MRRTYRVDIKKQGQKCWSAVRYCDTLSQAKSEYKNNKIKLSTGDKIKLVATLDLSDTIRMHSIIK